MSVGRSTHNLMGWAAPVVLIHTQRYLEDEHRRGEAVFEDGKFVGWMPNDPWRTLALCEAQEIIDTAYRKVMRS